MNGFDYLREQVKGQKDLALRQTVDYLISREEMEAKYLNKEKNIEDMAKFIREKGCKLISNGWNYVPNEVVYAWAVMYYSLPNSLLKFNSSTTKKANKKSKNSNDNVISLEKAKKDKKEEIKQISLFGGVDNDTEGN